MKGEANEVNRAWPPGCKYRISNPWVCRQTRRKARELPGEAPAAILKILCWILNIPLLNIQTKSYNKLSVPRDRECFPFQYSTHRSASSKAIFRALPLSLSPAPVFNKIWMENLPLKLGSALLFQTLSQKIRESKISPQFNITSSIKI